MYRSNKDEGAHYTTTLGQFNRFRTQRCNRTWRTAIRGQIAIHAGQSKAMEDWHSAVTAVAVVRRCGLLVAETWLRENIGCFADLPRGQILGTVHIDPCSQTTTSQWHFPRYWGFYLSNPRIFEVSIPQKGKLGFWEVNLESYLG